MGSWSVNCGISNISITSGNDCVLLPLKKNTEYEGYLSYLPATLPIFGTYDDYGGLEDIVKDDNTKLIAKHFNITIEKFVQYLVDWTTYQRNEVNPTIKKLQKNEMYDELKDWSFMFIDRKVYDFMSSYTHAGYGGKGHLDFGYPEILKLIGFKYNGVNENNGLEYDPKRFKHEWEFNGQLFYGDGTWLYCLKTNGSIYNFFNIGEYSNSLEEAITIPEDKKWIGEKTMWQLWEHLDKGKVSNLLFWIIGKRNNEFEDILSILHKTVIPPKTLADKYCKEYKIYGNQLAELVTIRNNMHCMSGSFVPYIKYLTPQCGEYAQHQILLEKFTEINKSYIQED